MHATAAKVLDDSGLLSALRTTRIEMDALQSLSEALRVPPSATVSWKPSQRLPGFPVA